MATPAELATSAEVIEPTDVNSTTYPDVADTQSMSMSEHSVATSGNRSGTHDGCRVDDAGSRSPQGTFASPDGKPLVERPELTADDIDPARAECA